MAICQKFFCFILGTYVCVRLCMCTSVPTTGCSFGRTLFFVEQNLCRFFFSILVLVRSSGKEPENEQQNRLHTNRHTQTHTPIERNTKNEIAYHGYLVDSHIYFFVGLVRTFLYCCWCANWNIHILCNKSKHLPVWHYFFFLLCVYFIARGKTFWTKIIWSQDFFLIRIDLFCCWFCYFSFLIFCRIIFHLFLLFRFVVVAT